jgi:hypothetical protein
MSDVEPGDTMVEALRRANPVPADQVAGRRSLPSAHALYADVTAQRPRRVRKRVLLVAIAIIVLTVILIAATFVRRESSSVGVAPVCYSSASMSSPRVVAIGDDPRAACVGLWTHGRFGSGAAPNFDVCVLPSGVLAVFPGEAGSVCPRLDLPESSGDDRIARFSDDISREVQGTCIGFDPATHIIKREMHRLGVSGWTVERGARVFDADHPCASTSVDPVAHTVTVVAYPDPFPSTTTATTPPTP